MILVTFFAHINSRVCIVKTPDASNWAEYLRNILICNNIVTNIIRFSLKIPS